MWMDFCRKCLSCNDLQFSPYCPQGLLRLLNIFLYSLIIEDKALGRNWAGKRRMCQQVGRFGRFGQKKTPEKRAKRAGERTWVGGQKSVARGAESGAVKGGTREMREAIRARGLRSIQGADLGVRTKKGRDRSPAGQNPGRPGEGGDRRQGARGEGITPWERGRRRRTAWRGRRRESFRRVRGPS